MIPTVPGASSPSVSNASVTVSNRETRTVYSPSSPDGAWRTTVRPDRADGGPRGRVDVEGDPAGPPGEGRLVVVELRFEFDRLPAPDEYDAPDGRAVGRVTPFDQRPVADAYPDCAFADDGERTPKAGRVERRERYAVEHVRPVGQGRIRCHQALC